ncbi:cytochrome P450 4C1-like isoform X1 [Aethina tumida]|uniref:cytochrome P450 4C1-like isoform X1 n=2 Tax=Aethina tumida TaxID=116153 RepID=UPI002148E805|nr:cytochrome P450 4C1-like isoform X1 [Aethina tumida]
MMFEFLVLVIVVVLWVYYRRHTKHMKKYEKFYKLSAPNWLPFVGNSLQVLGKNLLLVSEDVNKNVGNPCVMFIPTRHYLTSKPADLKILLNHPNVLEKSVQYEVLKCWFRDSLLITEVPKWKKNRKLISKSFIQEVLNSFIDVMYEKTCILTKIIGKIDFKKNSIFELFEQYTLDTFCEATLGIESSILINNETKFTEAISEAQKLMMSRPLNPLEMNDFIFNIFFSKSKIIRNFVDYMNDFIQNIIDKKKILISENIYVCNKYKLPVLDLLLQNYKNENLNDEYIRNEMILFAAAATDTTAYTLSYTCLLLAMNPKIQENVYEEVMEVVGEYRTIDCSNLVNLKYTEMVINEALRLIPVIPLMGRRTTAEINLGEIVIPENTGIILDILSLHRNPEIYPDPLKYDPDRFLPEEVAKRPQYSFVPFSAGPRNCIGKKYAMMFMKMAIANIVRNFRISTKHKSIEEFKFESSIVMNVTHPVDCNFTSR